MNKKLLLFFIILFSKTIYSQQTFTGKITTEFGIVLSGVLVVNISNSQKTFSDSQGNFQLFSTSKDEIRFVKSGYERFSFILKPENFANTIIINLKREEIIIEEVKITTFKPSGNLKKDNEKIEPSLKNRTLRNGVQKYLVQKSDASVLHPKHGEFVQPVGEGFSIGKIHNRWDIIDFVNQIEKNLGDEYFLKLGLKKEEISNFLFFALKDFDKTNILKYGYYSDVDFMKIQLEIDGKITNYKVLKKSQ